MTPERWQRVSDLFEAALAREPSLRAAYLTDACADDAELQREVDSLLTAHEQPNGLVDERLSVLAGEILPTETAASLVGRTLGVYRVERELGRGGMGEVYLARDPRLHQRSVALKLLPAYFIADVGRVRRLQQEARAASALNHPNIVTIFEVGEADGLRFIVTEYIEGQTLRELLASGALPLRQALDIATQTAGALAAAHTAGIVHRDIKPENIMLRPDGYVKVLDFGLAKLTAEMATNEPRRQTADTFIQQNTMPGMVLGTINYMSPEQARGLPVDAGTDIWSLGVVLYEMVTGRLPFQGPTPTDVIIAIVEKESLPMIEARSVPAELIKIIAKTLAKDRSARYQTARDLMFDLQRLKQSLEVAAELERGSSSAGGRAPIDFISSAQAATQTADQSGAQTNEPARLMSGAGSSGRIKNHPRIIFMAAVVLVLCVAIGAYFYLTHSSRTINSIAVLPLVNNAPDANNEYLSEGLTESLINNLSQLPNVKVISLSSVLRYQGQQIDPQRVGRELNVRAVLFGHITQRGDSLAITTELVDTQDNSHLWGAEYNKRIADLPILQEEIAQEVSRQLRGRLSGAEQQRISRHYTDSTEAYQLYLQGRYYWNQRTEDGLLKGIKYFQQALDLDPMYALAYSGLADSYTALGYSSYLAPKDSFPKAKAAALKALELDPQLAEPHASLAYTNFYYDWNWPEAEKEFKRALEINPNYTVAHHWYSVYLTAMGRSSEAAVEIKRAQELDPLSLSINTDMGFELYYSGQYDQAIKELQTTLKMKQDFPLAHLWLGRAYQERGMYEESLSEFSQVDKVVHQWPVTIAAIGYVYGVTGRKVAAQQVLDELNQLAQQKYVTPYGVALVYIGLGEKESAFAALEKAFADRSNWLVWLKLDPRWKNIRSDPRFADLVHRVGLPQ